MAKLPASSPSTFDLILKKKFPPLEMDAKWIPWVQGWDLSLLDRLSYAGHTLNNCTEHQGSWGLLLM